MRDAPDRPTQDAAEPLHVADTQDGPGESRSPGLPSLPDRYHVQGELGRGGMGVVYRARDLRAGRVVALKVLKGFSGERLERFKREGELAARLDHPGIVRVHTAGSEGRSPYLVYELVEDATSLREGLECLAPERLLEVIAEAADALGHAHAAGVVHRDVKPENILIDGGGRARVTDFGLAHASGQERLTQTGQIVGTPVYMAPEQISASELTPATDVWALGVILYEALAGVRPFAVSGGLPQLMARILAGRPEPMREVAPGVSPALEAVCTRAMEAEPGQRFQDGAAFAAALRAARSASARRGLKPPAWIALGLVLIPLAALPFALWPGAPAAPEPPAPLSTSGPPSGDPAAALAALEELPPRARYGATGRWLEQHPEHPQRRRAEGWRRAALRRPLLELKQSQLIGARFVDEERLVSWAGGGSVTLWNLRSGTSLASFPTQGSVWELALSRDRSRLAYVGHERIGVVEIDGFSHVHRRVFSEPVQTVAFSPSGRWLAVGGDDRVVRIVSADTGEVEHSLPLAENVVQELLWVDEERLVVGAGSSRFGAANSLALWNWRASDRLWRRTFSSRARTLESLPGLGAVAMGQNSGVLTALALDDGSTRVRYRGNIPALLVKDMSHSGVISSSCSLPSRDWLITSSAGHRASNTADSLVNDVRVWKASSGELLRAWKPLPLSRYQTVDLSPSGDALAVVCGDLLQVWLTDALARED